MLDNNIWEEVEREEKDRMNLEIKAMWELVEMCDGETPPSYIDKTHPYFDVCPRCGKYRWQHLVEIPADLLARENEIYISEEPEFIWIENIKDLVSFCSMLCCEDHYRSPLSSIRDLDGL